MPEKYEILPEKRLDGAFVVPNDDGTVSFPTPEVAQFYVDAGVVAKKATASSKKASPTAEDK